MTQSCAKTIPRSVANKSIITVTDTAVTVLNEKLDRYALILQNNSSVDIWIRFCASSHSSSIKFFKLKAGSDPVIITDNVYLGEVSAVCEPTESGEIHAVEY